MSWVVANIRWIMLVAGALTCTMVYAAIAPEAALRSTTVAATSKVVFIGLRRREAAA